MANLPKGNGGDDERSAADGSRANGGGDGGRDRKSTPAGVILPGPEVAAARLAQLRRTLERTLGLCGDVERLVREGGFDARARALMLDLADHFEDELANISAGTGRALRRLARAA